MDWITIQLSFKLAFCTMLVLLPVGIVLSRIFAFQQFPGKSLAIVIIALPLVLPPTVLGFYLLGAIGEQAVIGHWYHRIFDRSLAFSFEGLLIGSIIFNLPFAVLPMQRAFASISNDMREASWCCGLSHLKTFQKIELPLAWPGIVAALILVFAHTLGEFGVVLMIGGNIPNETRTAAIAIYDYTQVLNTPAAARLSLLLLVFAFCAILFINLLNQRFVNHDHKHGS